MTCKMTASFKKKLFLLIFCLASITQGMYSTYFVSILTTIERIYQIRSKTAGAIISATEIGQILGSLFIAYYGGRGNKPKWISLCMTLSALAALISISPHFLLTANIDSETLHNHRKQLSSSSRSFDESQPLMTQLPYLNDIDLNMRQMVQNDSATLLASRLKLDSSKYDNLCRAGHDVTQHKQAINVTNRSLIGDHNTSTNDKSIRQPFPVSIIISVFFTCLLAIGFGSTAITTLGIPFMDDIISREESPLYLGMTIGLKIFGPALGFLLGSFCIQLNSNNILPINYLTTSTPSINDIEVGAWWLGLILISVPLLLLAIPMYYLSETIIGNDNDQDDYEDITYQAAEDHDIGGSHDFPAHIQKLSGDLEITSSRTYFSSEVDTSSSCEVLQACQRSPNQYNRYNYNRNIAFEQPVLDSEIITEGRKKLSSANNQGDIYGPYLSGHDNDEKKCYSQNVCLVVDHFGGLESTRLEEDENENLNMKTSQANSSCSQPSSTLRSSIASTLSTYSTKDKRIKHQQQLGKQHDVIKISNLSTSISRLIKNHLLLLRMLSAVLHILPIAGFYTFLPKYLIEQFRVSSSSASAISGLAGILFVGFGAFLGGTIIRGFNVNSKLMTRWIASSALLYTLGMLILMNLSCEQNQTVHYDSLEFKSTDCSALCQCSRSVFSPVCANGTTYFSPCLAGCKTHSITEDKIIFNECGCIESHEFGDNNKQNESSSSIPHVNLNVAAQGLCIINCDNLIWYGIIFSIFTLIHASCEVGSMMFNLRCVKSDDRTLALGLITFTSSLFGTIPCSIIYGSMVDYTCVHWDLIDGPTMIDTVGNQISQESIKGSCRAYDNDSFRYYLHGLTALVMFLAFIVDCIISSRANEVDFYDGKDDSKTDIRIGLKKSTETI